MKGIKYVSFEPAAVVSDKDWRRMSAEQRGVFWTVIVELYLAGGKIDYDLDGLKELCNCENFETVWRKIEKKFQIRNGVIKHKRVTSELTRAQQHRKAAVKAANTRWKKEKKGNASASDAQSQENESKRNGIEVTESETSRIRKDPPAGTTHITESVSRVLPSAMKYSSISSLQSPVSSSSLRHGSSTSLETSRLHFDQALRQIIRPLSQSDRTSFHNIGNWFVVNIHAGKFNEGIFQRVLEYAAEAAKGRSRNPAAVFTSILKRELGYKSD
jgi:uncharacterized protein YdaU (DUF1376 family)